MSSFARAAELFERLALLSPEKRASELELETDLEVRELAREMLAGDDDPLAGLETGVPGAAQLIGGVLEESDAQQARDGARDDAHFELANSPYRILGVLARGGMGIVLRARDEEIGRDVAIKVLRGNSRDAENARLRFIEEAQVAGQLEHPGIVPVYHLGKDDEGRPFFAMKLVEGETLAAHLAAREDLQRGRGRFLALFLKVCQTVAYAHARRVIHRDLKPANVMIGAFGEVQVLDWGLAKVLGTKDRTAPSGTAPETVRTESGSDSVSGTVMGTPRYMPPEQAQGEVEQLDRRSDVFSLGAILCEILTGEPPFPGTREEALEATREARLDPAYESLKHCGADPALIELACRSLAGQPADRPTDAGELAAAVEHSLAAVEERAHAAELAAEAARVKAESERRAKRLTLLLTSSAAIFAMILVGAWMWSAYQSERDAIQLSARVDSALNLADERFANARAAPVGERAPWDAAAIALTASDSILTSGKTTDEVQQRYDRLLAEFGREHRAAQAAAATFDQDRAMSTLLEEIRMPTGDGLDPYDYARMDPAYHEAFATYGIDVEDEAVAHKRLEESDIARELGQALDQWALGHQILSKQSDEERRERSNYLLTLASSADPHPVRDLIRTAMRERNVQTLRTVATEADDLSPESVILLAGGLRLADDHQASADLLRRAVGRHRGDFWLSFHAAIALRSLAQGGSDEAVAYFHGALGARPQSLEPRHLLGQNLIELGRIEQARSVFEELVQLAPQNGHWLAHVGECVDSLEGREQAMPFLAEAARLAPDDSYTLNWYGSSLRSSGEVYACLEPYRRAYEVDLNGGTAGRFASALWNAGDSIEAYAVFQAGISVAPNDGTLLYNAGTLARGFGELERAEEYLLRCVQVRPEFPQARCNLGSLLMDMGRYEEALTAYRECEELGRRTANWNYPTDEWIAWAERSARFASELETYLDGTFDPSQPYALELAAVALARGRTVAASDWFARAYEHTNDLPLSELDLGTRAAALAAGNDGLDANERVSQAERALAWFERIREPLMRDFRAYPDRELKSVRSWLQGWQRESSYNALRDLDPALFSEELRAEAEGFWAEVEADLREISEWLERSG